jgi:hypothetical protein
MKSRVLESFAGTTPAKWMECSSTMPWQSGQTLHIGQWTGMLVKGWRCADEIIFIAVGEMAVRVMTWRVLGLKMVMMM